MDRVRGVQPDPGMPVLVVVIGEEHAAERAGVRQRPEPAGKSRAVLQRLELRLAVGLSLLTFGRECDLRIARSDSSADTGLDVIEVPRSAVWPAARCRC